MILADYRRGCTWVGKRSECLDYCGKHGKARRRMHRVPAVPDNEKGWCWEFGPDGTKTVTQPGE